MKKINGPFPFCWMMAIVFFLMTTPLLLSCGGGGSGDGGGSSDPAEATGLTLSSDRGIPGTFITVEDDSITEGEDLSITFSDSSGYEVTIKSYLVEDGSAKIPVPPYVGEETGDLEAGTVTVSIPNGNRASFRIEALPDLEDIETGTVLKAYLEAIRDGFEAHLSYMDEIGAAYEYDTEEIKDRIRMQIDDIAYTLNELDTTGTVSNDSAYFERSLLSESELKTVDQLLYALLLGIYNEGNPGASASLDNPDSEEESLFNKAVEYLRRGAIMNPGTWLPDTNNNIRAAANAMAATLEAMASKIGGRLGSAVYSKVFKPFVKATNVIFQGLSALITDAERFAREGVLTVSQEVAALARKLYETYGADILLETEDYYNKLSPIVKWILKKKCELGFGDYRFFCDNRDKSRLQVVKAYFEPTGVQSGTEARLNFTIYEYLTSLDLSMTSHIHIDWGDGDASDLRWGESHSHEDLFGNGELGHTYSLQPGEASHTYTAWVIVKGDNDAEYSHQLSASVKIVSDMDPITIAFNGPRTLDVNQLGQWTMDVSGGFGPYEGKLNWGEGATLTATSDFGEFKASHRYETAGVKTMTLSVTDMDGNAGSRAYAVTVGDETEACHLDYWRFWVSTITDVDAEITLSGNPDYPSLYLVPR